jgi:hypothetical protein
MEANDVGNGQPGTVTVAPISKRPSPNSSLEVSNNGNSSTIVVHADASDPLVPIHAPKLNIDVKWTVSACGGTPVTVKLAGSHSEAPAFEGIADGKLDYGFKGPVPGFFSLGFGANHDITPPPPLTLTD